MRRGWDCYKPPAPWGYACPHAPMNWYYVLWRKGLESEYAQKPEPKQKAQRK